MPKSKNKVVIPRYRGKPRLFEAPLLLVGEDAAAYDDLSTGIRAAVKPIDTIYELFAAGVTAFQWEVQRYRRLKFALLQIWQCAALKEFLADRLHCRHYEEDFVDEVAEILAANLPEDQADSAKTLAHAYAQNNSDANKKVDAILARSHLNIDDIEDRVRECTAEELAQKYARRETNAVKIVDKTLASANTKIDDLLAKKMTDMFDAIEQIDRLITVAENRRNSCLHEIDRHRAALGQALRRTIQDVEDAEYQVIETPRTKGKR